MENIKNKCTFKVGDKAIIRNSNTLSGDDNGKTVEIVRINGWIVTVRFDKEYPFSYYSESPYGKISSYQTPNSDSKRYRLYTFRSLEAIKDTSLKPFTKYDLQNGDVVITDDDSMGTVIIKNDDVDSGIIRYTRMGHNTSVAYEYISDIKDDMTMIWKTTLSCAARKIILVYRSNNSIGDIAQEKYCIYDRKKVAANPEFNRDMWIDKYFTFATNDSNFVYSVEENYGLTYGYITQEIEDECFGKCYAKKVIRKVSAKCSSNDKFDLRTGIAIVYAKLKGERIPEEI